MENSCRICHSSLGFVDHKRVVNGYHLFQCLECHTVLVKSPPENSLDNSGEYDELFSEGAYEDHRRNFFQKLMKGNIPVEFYRQYIIRKLEHYITKRNIVEIGGGVGAFGKYCANRGWNYVDYDISSVAVNFARQLGLSAEILDPKFPKIPSANVVVMWEVIEHIWNVYDYLISIKESLTPNGFLLLSTPNYHRKGYRTSEYWGIAGSPPVHVNFFTKESIPIPSPKIT